MIVKSSVQSSMFFYRVHTDPAGLQTLEEISFKDFTPEITAALKSVVEDFNTRDDRNLLGRIAAGMAAKRMLDKKAYRGLGLTKIGFCKKEFGRSPRTIGSYVAAAESYEAIGGLGCPIQPTSIDQLDAVALIRPSSRKDFWLKLGGENHGTPPSGEMLERRATEENLLIPKRRSKPKPSKVINLPCTNLDEATVLAEAQMKADPKGPWAKMHGFLMSLAKRQEQSAPEPKAKAVKPKPIRDVRGQTLMFEEVFQPVPASVVDQLEIPKIG